MSYVVGIDLGGTNMQVGVVGSDNVILGRHAMKTEAAQGRDAVIDRMIAGVDAACADAGISRTQLAAIGVAAPGAIDMPRGVVLEAPNLGWQDTPLRDLLSEQLGCHVTLDNDVNAAVWGEYQLGAGRGCNELLGIWVGTGVGGGLVIAGRLYHGPMFTAGEVGQTIIMPHEPRGSRTVEDLCSRSGMSRVIDRLAAGHPESILHDRPGRGTSSIDMRLLIEAFHASDPVAVAVVDQAADLLGIAIANWVTVLSLKRVMIGGGVTEAFGERFLQQIRTSFQANVFPARCRACELVITELEANAGLLGAALLARGK